MWARGRIAIVLQIQLHFICWFIYSKGILIPDDSNKSKFDSGKKNEEEIKIQVMLDNIQSRTFIFSSAV
jgi:hypothetical protein